MSCIEVLLFHHKGFVFFLSLSYPLIGDLVFLKEITVLFRVKQVSPASSTLFKSVRKTQVSTHTEEMRFQDKRICTKVYHKLEEKHWAEKLPGFVMVLWYFPSHFVFCGQQSSWESWFSFSVKLFLTIVWRKPWKSEARTPNSIRKIGGREETLQLFFKQSFMAFKAVLWFLQDTELDFVFKNLCAWQC